MIDEKPDAPAEKDGLNLERAQALALTLAASLKGVSEAMEKQSATIFGFAAVLAALPQAANVDPVRVAAIIQLMTSKQANPAKTREEMSRAASLVVDLSRRIREAERRSAQTKAAPPSLAADADDGPIM